MTQHEIAATLISIQKLLLEMNVQLNAEKIQSTSKSKKQTVEKEWLSIKEACDILGVAPNSLLKLRKKGLEVFELEGMKRINKYDLLSFMKKFTK